MDSIALTDHGVLYGAVEFYKLAKKNGIKPILGVETYVAPRDRFFRETGERYYHLILLGRKPDRLEKSYHARFQGALGGILLQAAHG